MKPLTALAFLLLISSGFLSPPPADRDPELFADGSLLELRIDAPFSELFSRAKGKPGGDVAVDGALSYTDQRTGRSVSIEPVKISIRGNSSRRDSECPFPKLRLDLDHAAIPAGSIFTGIKVVKLGTHCDDQPDGRLTKLGRWANEKSPIREALVYRLLEAADVPTLEARPARITYADRDRPPLVRGAMVLEDQDAAIARLGGTGELKNFTSARDDFAVGDAAAMAFGEAMIGNFDWALKFAPGDYYRIDHTHPLWNVIAVRRADGSAFPLMYDFDLAGIVAGSHPWFPRVYFEGFLPSRSHPAMEALGQTQRTRTLFPRGVLDDIRRRFVQARPALYRTVETAVVDDQGRSFARAYLDGFFAAITDDGEFYRPVVVQGGSVPYSSPDGAADACGAGDRIPVGTGVGAPIARNGSRVQVPLLDVWWHWASRCDAVHTGPVWIDAGTISRDFPTERTDDR